MIRLNYVGKVPLEVSQVTPVYGGDSLLQSIKNRLAENNVSLIRSVVLTKCCLYVSQDENAVPPRRGRGGWMVGKGLKPIITFLSPRLPLFEADKKVFVDHINKTKRLILLPGSNLTTNVADWLIKVVIENYFTCPQNLHVSILPAPGVVTPRIGAVVKKGRRLNVVCAQCLLHFRFSEESEASISRCRRCGLNFLAGVDTATVLGENLESLANLLPPSEKSKRIARQMFTA